jgi:hypothetical protein
MLKIHNPPIRIENGSWAKSNEEKAMAFAKHLEKVFQPHSSANNDDDIYDFLNTQYQLKLTLEKFKVNRIAHIIHTKLNPRKNPGHDFITTRLKELPTSALSLLTAIYNAVLRTVHFPSQWNVM